MSNHGELVNPLLCGHDKDSEYRSKFLTDWKSGDGDRFPSITLTLFSNRIEGRGVERRTKMSTLMSSRMRWHRKPMRKQPLLVNFTFPINKMPRKRFNDQNEIVAMKIRIALVGFKKPSCPSLVQTRKWQWLELSTQNKMTFVSVPPLYLNKSFIIKIRVWSAKRM